MEYFLEYNEPLVRMRVTGKAGNTATTATSVVTSWTVRDGDGNPPAGMSYPTANHWNGGCPSYTPICRNPDYLSLGGHPIIPSQTEKVSPHKAQVFLEAQKQKSS